MQIEIVLIYRQGVGGILNSPTLHECRFFVDWPHPFLPRRGESFDFDREHLPEDSRDLSFFRWQVEWVAWRIDGVSIFMKQDG